MRVFCRVKPGLSIEALSDYNKKNANNTSIFDQ
jgi:hypothetical protein